MPTTITIVQPDAPRDARCPKCANTHGIKDGGPSRSARRAYDILHDSFGLLRCPACGFKAGAAEFKKPLPK
jgi:predicted nucleic-acid-binding Zn-ribbon protein